MRTQERKFIKFHIMIGQCLRGEKREKRDEDNTTRNENKNTRLREREWGDIDSREKNLVTIPPRFLQLAKISLLKDDQENYWRIFIFHLRESDIM